MSDYVERNQKAMSLIVSRGLFAKEFNMQQLVELSREVSALGSPGDLVSWTLISHDYVYTGRAADKIDTIAHR